ncbi:MAG: hypothetical protein EAX87_01045 [Candidatus Thorarchaeota archaeon]|nr:hypothetical protein [Candidatus Thorarchaeota archaeon]
MQLRNFIPHVILLAYQILMYQFTVDDAFITFRFAENLAKTGQFVWNIGDAPLEGSSTFFLTVLLAPFAFFGADLVVVSKFLGIISFHAILIVLNRITLQNFSREYAFIPPLLLAVIPASGVHSISGMETATYMLFIVLLIWRYDHSLFERLIFAFFVAITRTEGSLIVLAMLSLDILYHRNRDSFISSIVVGIPIVVFQIGRLLYFGTLFSSPTAFKTVGFLSRLSIYTSFQFILYFIPLFFAMAMSLIEIEKPNLPTLRNLVLLVALVLVTWIWEPIMAYDFRFLFPAIVPLVILSTEFGIRLYTIAKKVEPRITHNLQEFYQLLWRLRYVIPIMIILFAPVSRIGAVSDHALAYGQSLENAHIQIGKYLFENAPPDSVIAVSDVGAIPFYSKLRTIDTYGLLTPEVFNKSGYNPDYVYNLEPDYLVIVSSSDTTIVPFIAQEIALVNDPSFSLYSPIGVYTFNPGYYLWLLVRL